MQTVTISQIEEHLRDLPPEKLMAVYYFVSYLARQNEDSESFQTMLASESALSRDWQLSEEDAAWANL
ncbi:MAG TPA: hypothetical protein VGB17_10510 [Pyrinomonadaceae bacterium]|jgi:hypothetical protein